MEKWEECALDGNEPWSPAMRRSIEEGKRAASSQFPVLLAAETGTEKIQMARMIHRGSSRAQAPFAAIDLAALLDGVAEGELFGYGSAPAAERWEGKSGLFERTCGGTVFLDGLEHASFSVQRRLLQLLQNKRITRVDESSWIAVNVRLIAAAGGKLADLIKAGSFLEELYYRIGVLRIAIPRLAERTGDIPLHLERFLQEINSRKRVSASAMDILLKYQWPGNLWELRNLACYLDIFCPNETVLPEDLPREFDAVWKQGKGKPFERNSLEEQEEFALFLTAVGKKEASDFSFILKQLHLASKSGMAMGRRKLYERSRAAGRPQGSLSVEQLRGRMGKLEQNGFIRIGKTRQGSCITDRGEAFLAFLVQTLEGER